MNEPKKFTKLFNATFKQGHHIYREVGTDRIVIADHSGDSQDPTTTDDGVLYIDFSRHIAPGGEGVYWVPLVNGKGETSCTPASTDEVYRIEKYAHKLFDRV